MLVACQSVISPVESTPYRRSKLMAVPGSLLDKSDETIRTTNHKEYIMEPKGKSFFSNIADWGMVPVVEWQVID